MSFDSYRWKFLLTPYNFAPLYSSFVAGNEYRIRCIQSRYTLETNRKYFQLFFTVDSYLMKEKQIWRVRKGALLTVSNNYRPRRLFLFRIILYKI